MNLLIETFEENFFQEFSNLKSLILTQNNLESIQANALNLVEIQLNANRLKTLPYKSFERLFNLETLFLNDNSICFIEENAFNYLHSLKEIHLSRNKIEQINRGLFEYSIVTNNKNTGLDSLKWFSFVLIEKESSLEELDSNIIEFDLNDEIKNEIKEIINVDDETIGEKEVDINENLSLDCVKEQSVSNTRDEKGLDSFLVEW